MSYQKLFDSKISTEAAKAWRAQGKKAVGTICCHVPDEIIRAAGILPVRMRATDCVDSSSGEVWMSTFSCSFARSILQYWMDGVYDLDGIVASDGCMMPSRVFDNAEYIDKKNGKNRFFYQIGAPRIVNDMTLSYYVDELKELIERLEKFSGVKVTDEALKEYIAKYNEARVLVQQVAELRKADNPVINGQDFSSIILAYTDYPIEEYIEMLKEFLADAKNRKPYTEQRARLMIIGSALDDPGYLKIVEDKGGIFVADALCFGTRAFPGQLEVDDKDVLGSIAKYYLERLVCPRMMDDRATLHEYIINTAKEYKVDGIIYEKMQYCECWGGESVLLEDELKEAGIPLLTVEREEHLANAGQLAIRAEAFIEMIEK
ncbi:MAG: 2-hydroxyacyl-CoA dehydratase [Clostridiales bacterium]|jgi:benzoyl-CoA reductase subunit C|nr:2-hydroxyacyl-CoA dehydratase [Clostridiales bacterium]